MNIELDPVQIADKSVLRNLLELCHHDYSEFNREDVDAHGLFGYSYLDNYWTEPGRYAFFIRVETHLAGFVMIRRLEEADEGNLHGIAEFFVLRKYRRHGVGKTAAYAVFDHFPGRWRVEQEPENLPAQRFWRKIIAEYSGNHYTETILESEGQQRPCQHFQSPPMR